MTHMNMLEEAKPSSFPLLLGKDIALIAVVWLLAMGAAAALMLR